MDKIRILKTLSKQFIAQEKYEEAVKCLEAASNAVDALPVERATACVQMAILVLEYFDEVDFARAKLLQAERELVATTQQQEILYAKTVSLLVRCCRTADDAIATCRKGLDFIQKRQEWKDNLRLQKRWKAHFLFQMCRYQVTVHDEGVDSTLESLDSLSSALSYEEKTVLAMTHAIREMKRQHPDAADKWLTETATELGNAFKKNTSGNKLSLESLRAHYYLIYALNAHLSGRAGQLASEGSYPAFEELFKSMERIGDETLPVDNLQPPLDNACANILGEMLHANLLRLSGHGGDAAIHAGQIEESLEQIVEKVGKTRPIIQLQLVNLEYRCLSALVICDFQSAAECLTRAGKLIQENPESLRDHIESVSLLLGQYFHSTREYDAALEVFNSIHSTMATLCAALTELHVEKHQATSACARMNLLKELHLNSLPIHERSIVQMINGLILCRQNDSTGARLLFTKSLKQAHGMVGSGQFVGQILNCLAPVQQERNDIAGALQMFESSATLLKSVKDLVSLVTTLKGMEKLYTEMKDNEKASSCRQYLEKKSDDLTGRLQRVYDDAHHKECITLANRLKSLLLQK